jgi:hypothetical protein
LALAADSEFIGLIYRERRVLMPLRNAGIIKPTGEEIEIIQQDEVDAKWWNEHAEEIGKMHKGKYIAILNKEAFPGDSYEDAYQKAKAKYPTMEPFVDHIPFKREVWVL